jgi:hypothetical protein
VKIDFINEIAQRSAVGRRDLVEKDTLLHQTLTALAKDALFSSRFSSLQLE